MSLSKEKEEDLRNEFKDKFDVFHFSFPRIRGEVIDFWIPRISSLLEEEKVRLLKGLKDKWGKDG